VVAILGAGPIGMSALLLAKASGAKVFVTDTVDFRLEVAKRLGADITINIEKENLLEKIQELTDGEGVCKVIEAVGGRQDITLQQAVQIGRRGGLIVVVGNFSDNRASIRITEFKDREMELKGSRGQHGTFRSCMELISSGRVDVEPMISHIMPFDQAEKALKMMENKDENISKIILTF